MHVEIRLPPPVHCAKGRQPVCLPVPPCIKSTAGAVPGTAWKAGASTCTLRKKKSSRCWYRYCGAVSGRESCALREPATSSDLCPSTPSASTPLLRLYGRNNGVTAELLCARDRRPCVTQQNGTLSLRTAQLYHLGLLPRLELPLVAHVAMPALLAIRAPLRAPEPRAWLALAHAMQLRPNRVLRHPI